MACFIGTQSSKKDTFMKSKHEGELIGVLTDEPDGPEQSAVPHQLEVDRVPTAHLGWQLALACQSRPVRARLMTSVMPQSNRCQIWTVWAFGGVSEALKQMRRNFETAEKKTKPFTENNLKTEREVKVLKNVQLRQKGQKYCLNPSLRIESNSNSYLKLKTRV